MQSRLRTIIILGGAILTFALAVSAIGSWKYAHYRYGGMDLAIYTNVVWNLSQPIPQSLPPRQLEYSSTPWYSSIQGSSYLGDHVEPVLLLLIPLFRLWPDPRLVLILQAFVFGLTAIPIFLLLSLAARRTKTVSAARDAVRPHDSAEASRQLPAAQHGETQTGAERREAEFGRGIPHASEAQRPTPERLVRRTAPERKLARHGPTLLSLLWLLNPLMWNAALFEFHALAFAPLFLLSAAYCYIRRRLSWFLLWLLLSLSVREDIAFVVIMFGAMAFLEMRNGRREQITASMSNDETRMSNQCRMTNVEMSNHSGFGLDSSFVIRNSSFHERHRRLFSWQQWRWVAIPIVLGVVWFFLATRIAAAHSPSGAYKFLVYYGWIRDAIGHPLALLRHFLSIGNLDMALGLLLPFLFLPLLRSRWLLLALPPLFQILLAEPGGSNVVVELHYGLLFVPALVLATIEALQTISPPLLEGELEGVRLRKWFASRFPLPRQFAIGLGIATYLATAWMLGPFPGIANAAVRGASADERTRAAAYDELLARVPPDAPIAAGYAALPHIAARSGAYALPYAYLGANQYAFAPYELPADLQFILLDQHDALTYAVQFPSVRWSAPYAAEGSARLQKIIADGRFGIVAERDGVALLERDAATAASDGIDQRYLAPDHPVRGRLIIDPLRDIVVQLD